MRIGPLRFTSEGWRLAALACGLALVAFSQKKKDETQTLQLPRDLPGAVEGDPRRFTFHVTPLSSKGLLTKQVRDALTALNHEAGGNPVLKIRAFVAGSGDVRRVRDLVSEFFTERRQPLPVLSLVQAGGLPVEGAQVVLEGIAAGRKEASPYGLVLVAAQAASSANPLDPVAPLAAKSIEALRVAVKAAGSAPADVARVTCFLSSLENLDATRKLVAADYPGAAVNYVQAQRSPVRAVAACEAVARLRHNTGVAIVFLNPEGLPQLAGEPQVALVGAHTAVLTGSQVSFGFEEKDARLAFERLQKVLEQSGTSPRLVAFGHYYVLATGIAEQVRKVRAEFFGGKPPAGSMLLFEGLPSLDAGFAMDVLAAKE
jgi:enamine deaminase RidA (YjgF/YER057c/UK114 family)